MIEKIENDMKKFSIQNKNVSCIEINFISFILKIIKH